jgi:hypothetical protein
MREDTDRLNSVAPYPAKNLALAATSLFPPPRQRERRGEYLDLLTSSSSQSYFTFSKSPMLQLLSKYAFVGA